MEKTDRVTVEEVGIILPYAEWQHYVLWAWGETWLRSIRQEMSATTQKTHKKCCIAMHPRHKPNGPHYNDHTEMLSRTVWINMKDINSNKWRLICGEREDLFVQTRLDDVRMCWGCICEYIKPYSGFNLGFLVEWVCYSVGSSCTIGLLYLPISYYWWKYPIGVIQYWMLPELFAV